MSLILLFYPHDIARSNLTPLRSKVIGISGITLTITEQSLVPILHVSGALQKAKLTFVICPLQSSSGANFLAVFLAFSFLALSKTRRIVFSLLSFSSIENILILLMACFGSICITYFANRFAFVFRAIVFRKF